MHLNASTTRCPYGRSGRTLALLVLLTVALRAPGVLRPLTGNFSTRAVVNAMMARNWAAGRASLWYPMLDVLPRGESSAAPSGPTSAAERSLHLVEFPVSAYLTGLCWSACGGSLDVWGRLLGIVCCASSTGLLYALARRWHGETVAVVAALVIALSPVGIIYGQGFMFEPSLVALLLGSMYGLDRWIESRRMSWMALSALCLALLLLTKIYMLVVLLPLAAMALRAQLDPAKRRLAIAALALAVLPAFAWSWHVFTTSAPGHPLAERLYYSYRHSAAAHQVPHPLLLSASFYGGVARDLGTVVLTPVGLLLAAAGMFHASLRRHWPWLFASLVLVLALPLKFSQMNYYYLTLLPPLALAVGLGWEKIQARISMPPWATAAVFAAALLMSLRYSVRPAFITPAEDRSVVAAGKAVQRLTGGEEIIATMHGSAIDLLYYSERPGWNIAPDQSAESLAEKLERYRRRGATLLVVAGGEPFPGRSAAPPLINRLPLIEQGDGYWIYRLARQEPVSMADASTDAWH